MNFDFIQKTLSEIREKGKYSREENFDLTRVQHLIEKGKIPICLINFDKFAERDDKKMDIT